MLLFSTMFIHCPTVHAQEGCESLTAKAEGFGMIASLRVGTAAQEAFCEEIEKMIDTVRSLSEDLAAAQARLPPRGSVIIVDDPEGCPTGTRWIEFEELAGKTVIGEGIGLLKPSGTAPITLAERAYRHEGGAEGVALSEAQMPSHTHQISDPKHAHAKQYGALRHGNREFISGSRADSRGSNFLVESAATGITIASTGSGQLHNNMPPYMALYFCKYDPTG